MYVETRILPATNVECFSYKAIANPQPQAIILVGLPCSGKSTFRKNKLIPSLKYRARSFALYSTDDYLEEMAATSGVPYQEVFTKRFREAQRYAQDALDAGLSYGCDLIFDQTNLSVAKRKSILDKLPHTYSRAAVYFEPLLTGQHEAMLAARKDKAIPSKVIEEMKSQYVRPIPSEGFDTIANYWETTGLMASLHLESF
jgi:predicted kinase